MAINQGGIGGMVRRNVDDFYANKRKIADELAGRAAAYEPIYDPWVGLAKLATAGIAGWNRDRLMRRQQEDEKGAMGAIANALQGDKIDYNALGGNQFTAPIAAELQLNERQAQLDRNQRRADGLFGQGLQQGQNGVEFIPGYLEAQQQLAGLRRNERENWTPIRDKQGNIIGQQNNNGKMDMFNSPENRQLTPWGNGEQAQSVWQMVQTGKLTKEQADAYMASKYIIDPATGQAGFVTPEKFAATYSGGTPSPSGTDGNNPAASKDGFVPVTGPKQSDKTKVDASKINSIRSSFDTYSKLLDEVGPDPIGSLIGSPKAIELEAAHRDLLLNLKEAYNLGVLNGPDYQLMLDVVNDPNSLRGGWIGKEGLQKQLEIIRNKLDRAQVDFLNANPGASNLINPQSPSQPNQKTTTPTTSTQQTPPKVGKPVLDAQGNLVDSATGKIIAPAGR